MNPLELTRKTPMTNCGACGHPTCLAFAAAVLKAGEDPGRCKDLDPAGLNIDLPGRAGLDDLPKKRDLALVQHLKGKIAGLDFAQIAPALGASIDAEDAQVMEFSYLAGKVRVTKDGLLINNQAPQDPRDQILLYNYISAGGGRPLSGEWIGLESLPNTISKVRTLKVYGEEPIARLFSGKTAETIMERCLLLDAEPVAESSASVAVVFPVMPMVSLQVHYWEEAEEEGFAAQVKILFDRYVLDYLDLESLVFTAERLSDRLAELFEPDIISDS